VFQSILRETNILTTKLFVILDETNPKLTRYKHGWSVYIDVLVAIITCKAITNPIGTMGNIVLEP
jgi:hypothetical protein